MRRLKRKGYLLFFLSLLSLSTLCGCGGNTASSAASKEKTDSGEGITTEAAEDQEYDQLILSECRRRWV